MFIIVHYMTLVWSLVMSSALFHDEMPALVDHTVEDLEKTFKRCFNKRYCIFIVMSMMDACV